MAPEPPRKDGPVGHIPTFIAPTQVQKKTWAVPYVNCNWWIVMLRFLRAGRYLGRRSRRQNRISFGYEPRRKSVRTCNSYFSASRIDANFLRRYLEITVQYILKTGNISEKRGPCDRRSRTKSLSQSHTGRLKA
jgi:hypothetical protein